jgi:hypothetical protein
MQAPKNRARATCCPSTLANKKREHKGYKCQKKKNLKRKIHWHRKERTRTFQLILQHQWQYK